jgi:predicted RNase H-like HicB family nuclease
MKSFAYTVNVTQSAGGGFEVSVPAMAGCLARGDTYAGALSSAREAMERYLEALADKGGPMPAEDHCERPQVVVTVEPLLPPSDSRAGTWSIGRSRSRSVSRGWGSGSVTG